ncbi:penicillin-binding protein 1A, PBP-1a [Candidatus Moduliflexus flocculans]|uniref:peptidoglycan glycosyltransferase n=1 Tax=Candidatus Moduliflexus flocculans TaxID=1499966 RepID=A0A081BT76_9BACT|nr:penicillin-binding protein 1A, PBP-1a [Candidatus Moduliflexus flocculans]
MRKGKRKHFWLIMILLMCGIILSLPYLIYKSIYFYEIRHLPDDTSPVRNPKIPETLLDIAWKEFGGIGERIMMPIHFDHYAALFLSIKPPEQSFPSSSETTTLAARLLLFRRYKHAINAAEWKRLYAAAFIWVSHHWTIDEALTTILTASYYGHGIFGIERAAKIYFQKPVNQLEKEEMASLVVILRCPGACNPWCYSENNLRQVNRLFISLEMPPLERLPHTLTPPPENACIKMVSQQR